MKNEKRILSLILAFVIMLSSGLTAFSSGISTEADAMDISAAEVAVVAENSLIMAIKSHNALVNNVKKTISEDKSAAPIYKENSVLVPAKFFAENIGAVYTADSNGITITKNGKIVSMNFGEKKLTYSGQTMKLSAAPCIINNIAYIPVKELCFVLNMYLFLDGDLLICNENEMDLSWSNNKGVLRAICERFIADDVEGSEIVELVKRNWPDNQHPRMIMTQEKFDEIKAEIAKGNNGDPVYLKLYQALEKKCNSVMNEDPLEYELRDGVRLMQVCDSMQARYLPLALMYNITGNEEYAVRAKEEILAACSFKDWHPYHFLDTGIMASGIALAYDWLYNWLKETDPDFLVTMREAIVEKAIKQVMNDYDGKVIKGTDDGNLLKRTTFWATDNGGNWRFVAGGGVATAALAICDELTGNDLAMAERSLKEGLKGIRVSLCEFSPDGSNEEGTGYWDFSSRYFHRHILSLISSVGDDFGYLDYPGLDKTNGWLMSTSGPVAGYSFHDAARVKTSVTPSTMCWALDYKNYGEAQTRINQILAGSGNYQDMMFYDPILLSGQQSEANLDIVSEATGVFTSRSDWSTNATWLGFHADVGIATASHKHSDGGSFALQSMGEEWFFDLGSDEYTIPDYRQTAYRCRAEGHNGILLNPGQGQYGAYDMQYEGFCKIDRYDFNSKGSYAISNITDLWREDLESGWRGVKFDKTHKTVTVQDELVMKNPSEFYWFAHTEADIEISEDGKTAYLTKNGKTLLCEIVHGDGAKFSDMDAKPLPTSPECEGQDANEGIHKLTIHMQNVSELNLTVVFNNYDDSYDANSYSKEFIPMQEWTAPETNVCLGKAVTADVGGKASNNSGIETNMVDGDEATRYITKETPSNAWNTNAVTIDLADTFLLGNVTIRAFASTAGIFNFNRISIETGITSDSGNTLWSELVSKTAVSSDTKYLTFTHTIAQKICADKLRITFYKDGEKTTDKMEIQEIEAYGVKASDNKIMTVSSITYKQGGNIFADCPKNGEFSVCVTYENVESPMVIVVFYDESGDILDIAKGSPDTELLCDVPSDTTISKVRIFTWEDTTCKPILLTAYDYRD